MGYIIEIVVAVLAVLTVLTVLATWSRAIAYWLSE